MDISRRRCFGGVRTRTRIESRGTGAGIRILWEGSHAPSGSGGRRATAARRASGRRASAVRGMMVGVSIAQPTLSLWDEPAPSYRDRIVAHADDRIAWLRARARGVTATDVARMSSENALRAIAMEKLLGTGFSGNAFTQHGRDREPEIGRWANRVYGMRHSGRLFHAEGRADHLATPDGLREHDGRLELCEIKTTKSAWRSIPRSYLRQVWWQQYVLGAERTLVVWERHVDFVPVDVEPSCRWVDRDESEIHQLVGLADRLLELMRR
jgi:hypothetical protein